MNAIEKFIACEIATKLIAAGHKISVDFERGYDTDEKNRDLTDVSAIIAASDEVDECWWMLDAERDGGGSKAVNGWIVFIWANGNDGRDCVSDYSTNLESHVGPATADGVDERLFARLLTTADLLKIVKHWEQFCQDNGWGEDDVYWLAAQRAAIKKAEG